MNRIFFKNVPSCVYYFFIIAFIALPHFAFPLINVSGKVIDKNTGEPLSGASVLIGNSYLNTLSNPTGEYQLKKLKAEEYEFVITYLGFETLKQKFELTKDTTINFLLVSKTFLQEEIIVEATRANAKTSSSYSQINSTEIANQNLGQDLPYMLNLQPSVVTTSDAGAGVGYTGIRIRGSDGTRINTTINGIPLNDAESQISYFVDVPDLLSSIDNIQIQRGVGTSTNGAGAFGGSINIETTKLNTDAYATIASSIGSFNTLKNTLNIGSGLLSNKFSFDGRLSKISSDGFVDRSKSDLQSYYLSGGYYGKNTTLKFITFSGTEKTYQSWNGVPEAKLKGDAEELLAYIERNNLSASDAQNVIQANKRTFNSFTYANQTDNYKQQNFQLHFSQRLPNFLTLTTALHYTKGMGYFEEYKEDELFENYQLNNLIINNDTLYSTDLVRQKWLENHFYGVTYALQYNQNKKVSATLGGAYNIYDGDHYGKIIWAQNNSNNNTNNKYYDDNGLKKDFTVYAKVNYQPFSKFSLFADFQFRSLDYSFTAYNTLLETERQNVKMNFINPKIGITYFLSANKTMYLNYSIANKEPSRADFIQSSNKSRPSPENLANWEFGYVQKNKRYTYSFNTYYMLYKNQLVLNGKVNDVGEYARTNVASSSRLGIEWTNTIKVFKNLTWTANATWSKNTIQSYFEYIDNYDSSFQEVKEYKNTAISFSPEWIASSLLTFSPVKNLDFTLVSKYVGGQFLDNTSNENRKLDAYFVNDFRINYRLHFKEVKEVLFSFMANNFINEMYESNGYTYNYIYGGKLIVENFYFPQAGRNYLLGVTLKFN